VATGQAYSITVSAADVDGNLSNVDVNWNDGTAVEHKTVSGSPQSVTFARSFSTARTITWSATAYDTGGLTSGQLEGSFNVTAVTTVSAASYLENSPLAPGSIASSFGKGLASTTTFASPESALPTLLAGTTVKVTDSAGTERASQLWFVSPAQINYYIEEGTAIGAATVKVSNQTGVVAMDTLQIDAVAPGLFSMNANGQGVAAAVAVWAKPDDSQTWQYVFAEPCIPGSCVPTPLDRRPDTDRMYLLLYGTGIRGRSSLALEDVSATIGGMNAPVDYAGPVAGYTGLDQVNLRVPPRLAGSGEVNVVLVVDGKKSNTVTINIR
jgi:uncharacterized protein (TIGR03437 family)